MGIARLRKLTGDVVPRQPEAYLTRREKPAFITCLNCGREINAREGTGACGRCATIAHRIATTGSPTKRLINQPSRHARRARGGKGQPR